MTQVDDRLRSALEGRYRIEREIGRGGMAIVFLAYDEKHKRQVALKVLRPEISAVVGAERFHREIEIAARLQHPHILPLHDSGEADGLLYYVMPFVVGESLRDLLSRMGRLHWKEAASIASEVASALHYAHGEHVIHRDIKPGNILISQGHAVVADFGIAHAVSATREHEHGAPLEFAIGTPAYMSPEQALSDPDVDGRSDVYSLGCVMYEMLCGDPPADQQTTRSFLLKDTHHTPPRFDGQDRWQIPRGIRGATVAALAPDRRDRYQTAAELRAALTQAMRGGGSPVRWATQLVGSAVVLLGLVYFVSLELGLPSWVFQALAIVSGIQIGVLIYASRIERAGQRLKRLSRRRIQAVGAVAVVAVGLVSGLYMTGRAFGWVPAEAETTGAVGEQPLVLLMDFVNRTPDSFLGLAATDAFRVDLAQSGLLFTLQTPNGTGLPGNETGGVGLDGVLDMARDGGVPAVLVGEITTVGHEYLLTARLVSPADRTTLAAERVTASSADAVIAAIDTLSARMRQHALQLRATRPK
jgi:tRNA A-37 threonylcarbamoyl transferase component Bud32